MWNDETSTEIIPVLTSDRTGLGDLSRW